MTLYQRWHATAWHPNRWYRRPWRECEHGITRWKCMLHGL